jgi:hypothetical protein
MICTSILIYVLVRFLIKDTEIINTGWHTTIYPTEIISMAITILILLFISLAYLLFSWFYKN